MVTGLLSLRFSSDWSVFANRLVGDLLPVARPVSATARLTFRLFLSAGAALPGLAVVTTSSGGTSAIAIAARTHLRRVITPPLVDGLVSEGWPAHVLCGRRAKHKGRDGLGALTGIRHRCARRCSTCHPVARMQRSRICPYGGRQEADRSGVSPGQEAKVTSSRCSTMIISARSQGVLQG